MTLCQANGDLFELAAEKTKFRKKVKFLRSLGLRNEQLIEAPWIFSAPSDDVAQSMDMWREAGYVSPHPLLLLPNETNPILVRPQTKRGKPTRIKFPKSVEREKRRLADAIDP